MLGFLLLLLRSVRIHIEIGGRLVGSQLTEEGEVLLAELVTRLPRTVGIDAQADREHLLYFLDLLAYRFANQSLSLTLLDLTICYYQVWFLILIEVKLEVLLGVDLNTGQGF